MHATTSTSIEGYQAIRLIGRGGFGIVEEVENARRERFARKTFAPATNIPVEAYEKLRRRFQREVQTQQCLGGGEILPVIDHSLGGNNPWFIMPLAEATYQDKIHLDRNSGSIDMAPLADILNGLQRLHDLGYVHRDLNPNNILFSEGTWKLSDLGSVLPPSGHTVTLTEDTIIYTERYCAPEQRQDFHRAQPSADVYSLGCILHDLFGKPPRTPYASHTAPGSIGIIIEKCTHPIPSKRPKIESLRPLLFDILLKEGGYCEIEDAQASEWLRKMEGIDNWNDTDFDEFARFFAELNTEERSAGHENAWVYSLSTPFMTRVSNEMLRKIVSRQDGISCAIVGKYCEWARNTAFDFNFSDNVCGRLTTLFDHGTPSDKASTFAALGELGYTHHRYYIMRCMLARCKRGTLTPDEAKRLSIELRIEGLEEQFKSCFQEIGFSLDALAPELAAICA